MQKKKKKKKKPQVKNAVILEEPGRKVYKL